MRIKSTVLLTWAFAVLAPAIAFGMPFAVKAQDQANPDNSAQNKAHAKTADNQKENTPDREITQRIRQSIIADKYLSNYAHNVKIITQDGQVTLKGPVKSQGEKETIASKASDVVGAEKVDNQLTVKQ